MLTEVLRQATSGALDLFDRPDVLNPSLYPSRLEIVNGIYPSFSDCPMGSHPNAAPLRYVQARLGMDAPDRPPSLNDQLLYLTLMQLFSVPWKEAALPEVARPAETALITFGNIERLEETLLRVSDGEDAVQVRIDTAGVAFHLRQEAIEENTPEPRKPLRLGIVLDEPSVESVIRLTITPVMMK